MDINGLMTIPPYGDDPTFHQSHKWSSEFHTCAKGEWLAPASSAVRTKRSWSCGVAKNCASAKAVQFGDPEKWVLPRYVSRNIHEYCKQIIYSIYSINIITYML
jgi:hypothetical protein